MKAVQNPASTFIEPELDSKHNLEDFNEINNPERERSLTHANLTNDKLLPNDDTKFEEAKEIESQPGTVEQA